MHFLGNKYKSLYFKYFKIKEWYLDCKITLCVVEAEMIPAYLMSKMTFDCCLHVLLTWTLVSGSGPLSNCYSCTFKLQFILHSGAELVKPKFVGSELHCPYQENTHTKTNKKKKIPEKHTVFGFGECLIDRKPFDWYCCSCLVLFLSSGVCFSWFVYLIENHKYLFPLKINYSSWVV